MDGLGEIKWPDGRYHKGYYKQDKKDGRGIYIWSDGKKFIGEWVDGK